MKYSLVHIFMCIIVMLATPDLNAQHQWILKKNSNGIAVYISPVEGSSYKAFKAISTFSAGSIHEIAAAILDVENYATLYPDTRKCKLIKKFTDGHFIHYMLTDAPWPADDRDGVYEIRAAFKDTEEIFKASITCINGYVPIQKGVVRMTHGSGHWEVKKVSGDLYELTYQYHGEAGGNVPAWLANTSIVSIPFKTLTNLKNFLSKGKYRDVKLDFMN